MATSDTHATLETLLNQLKLTGTPQSTIQDFQKSFLELGVSIDTDEALIAAAQAAIADYEAEVTAEVTGDPDFGSIGTATEVEFTLSHDDHARPVPVLIYYTGDTGAFALTELNGIDIDPTPGALVDDYFFPFVIDDDEAAAPFTFKVTALAADDGVEKTGTLTIHDSWDDQSPPAGDNAIGTIALVKTYNS